MSSNVDIPLSADEALVFYDWLVRFNAHEDRAFADPSEQRVLWDLEAILEKQLAASVSPDYGERLAQARVRVRDSTR